MVRSPFQRLLVICCCLLSSGGAYLITDAYCPVGREIIEDQFERIQCIGTDENMTWSVYHYDNATWREVVTCRQTACSSKDSRYQATRPNSSVSVLEMLRTDRDNVPQFVRCQDDAGGQTSTCKLNVYHRAQPSGCWLRVESADRTVTGSCVTNIFYSAATRHACFWYLQFEDQPEETIEGRLDLSTVTVNGREYQNGTCSLSASLTNGYGKYRVSVFVSTSRISYHLRAIDFQPPEQVGTTTTDPDGRVPEEGGASNTVLYALIGVIVLLVIVIVVSIVFIIWRIRQASDGGHEMLITRPASSDSVGLRNRGQTEAIPRNEAQKC